MVVNNMKGQTWENSSRLESVEPKCLKCQRSSNDKNTPAPRLIINAVIDKGAWVKRFSFCSIYLSNRDFTKILFLRKLKPENIPAHFYMTVSQSCWRKFRSFGLP